MEVLVQLERGAHRLESLELVDLSREVSSLGKGKEQPAGPAGNEGRRPGNDRLSRIV